jgi:tetratricopeptide (TPR) repeat protein
MNKLFFCLIFPCLLTLGGCATPPQNQVVNIDPVKTDPVAAAPELPAKPFAIDSLYDLLVADVALNRNQFELALEKYLTQARQTRDPGVIQLAARVADYVRDNNVSLEIALLWIDVAPQDPEAHRTALQAYAIQGDAINALFHASWLYTEEADLDAFLAITSIQMTDAQTNALIAAYQGLDLNAEQQPFVMLASAILYRSIAKLEIAEQTVTEFLQLQPDNQSGLLLLAQLLHQQDRIDEAAALIGDALQRQPEDRKLRLQYARLLTITDLQQAIIEFEALRLEDPADQEINFLLALLLHNQGQSDRAMGLFAQASQRPSLSADSQFHMGSITESRGDITSAIKHYSQVRFGRNYLPAVSRLTVLLNQQYGLSAARQNLQRLRVEQPEQAVTLFQIESNLLVSLQKPEQAMSILTDGLNSFPNNSQLLYARSMVAEQQDNFALAEQDLRTLIAQDENNASALNALGYSMVVHTDRQDEAYSLIKRAYLLNPGDPAIIDSMGWVLFKLGELAQALEYLQKALNMLPDPEIAAHLGEVQWVMGNPEAALKTWRQGLQQAPDHPIIVEAMDRLGATE